MCWTVWTWTISTFITFCISVEFSRLNVHTMLEYSKNRIFDFKIASHMAAYKIKFLQKTVSNFDDDLIPFYFVLYLFFQPKVTRINTYFYVNVICERQDDLALMQ